MKRWWSGLLGGLVVLWALAGCAAVEPVARPDVDVFRDALFVPPARPPNMSALFTLTPAMQQHLVERIQPGAAPRRAGSADRRAVYPG